MSDQYADVTELAGTEITVEQLERMSHRYHWAASFCSGKDVVEVACGSGQGLGILSSVARSLQAGDISPKILSIPRTHYGSRVELQEMDAHKLPFPNGSKDVIILFEALYYVADPERFVEECRRILRPGGKVLIATANKDLPDFNPSPFSHRYFGTVELSQLFGASSFKVELFGYLPVEKISWRQRLLRPIKRLAVGLGLVPKTMAGKKLLKRLVFGRLVEMPVELPSLATPFEFPTPLPLSVPDTRHKVIYCSSTLTR